MPKLTATNSRSSGKSGSAGPAWPTRPLCPSAQLTAPSSLPLASFSAKAAPRAPCRAEPRPHPAITAPMRYSSNRQKVLRFCGAMVSPGPTLSASRAAACADQPFRPRKAASSRGSLALPPRQLARPLFSCHFPGAPGAGEQPGVGQSPPGTSYAAATPQPISAVHFTSEAARAASQTTELWPRPPANGERRRQRFAPPGRACDSERISGGEGEPRGNPSVHQSRDSFPVLTNCLREGLTWLPL